VNAVVDFQKIDSDLLLMTAKELHLMIHHSQLTFHRLLFVQIIGELLPSSQLLVWLDAPDLYKCWNTSYYTVDTLVNACQDLDTHGDWYVHRIWRITVGDFQKIDFLLMFPP